MDYLSEEKLIHPYFEEYAAHGRYLWPKSEKMIINVLPILRNIHRICKYVDALSENGPLF